MCFIMALTVQILCMDLYCSSGAGEAYKALGQQFDVRPSLRSNCSPGCFQVKAIHGQAFKAWGRVTVL